MSLRRKLIVTFAGLGFMTLLVAAVTLWAMIQWNSTELELREHYQRSLLLQEARGQTLQAVLEVPEGLTGNDADARGDFQEAIEPAEDAFRRWSDLADNDDERQEVDRMRATYIEVRDAANEAFDLIDTGNLDQAEVVFDNMEDGSIEEFEMVAQRAAAADQERRDEIRESTSNARRTAEIMLAIASFGALSLVLLLAAYLASDLFTPLKDIRKALESVRRGNRSVRLGDDRSDELGDISREFNAMVTAISEREQRGGHGAAVSAANVGVDGENGQNGHDNPTWIETPTRVTLHRMISRMRSDVARLGNGEDPQSRRELAEDIEELSHAVSRITEFSYPLDLNMERTDIRSTIYGVVQRFNKDLVERAVSIEVDIAPDVRHAMVDRLKIRESISELVQNALDALPDGGGKIGIRARISDEDEPRLLVEVADNGAGADQSLIDDAFERREDTEYSGLMLIKSVVEQHGGEFDVESEPGEGTYARMSIPMRD